MRTVVTIIQGLAGIVRAKKVYRGALYGDGLNKAYFEVTEQYNQKYLPPKLHMTPADIEGLRYLRFNVVHLPDLQ